MSHPGSITSRDKIKVSFAVRAKTKAAVGSHVNVMKDHHTSHLVNNNDININKNNVLFSVTSSSSIIFISMNILHFSIDFFIA